MTSLTYDSESKTFNAEIAIKTDSDSTLTKAQEFAYANTKQRSELENELDGKNIVPDPGLMQDLYKDSIIEEDESEKKIVENSKEIKKNRDFTDSGINIKLNLIKNNSQPIQTNFFLHKGQNSLLNHKCELIPNVSFDVNRTYTESADDENTYVSVDVYKRTIKKLAQSEKPIGQLKLKLEPQMKEKSSSSLDNHDSLITFTAFRKRLI